MNLIIFLTSYFIIILSIFGYSLALHDILKKKISLEFEFNFLGSVPYDRFLTLSFFCFFSFIQTSYNAFTYCSLFVAPLEFFSTLISITWAISIKDFFERLKRFFVRLSCFRTPCTFFLRKSLSP